MQSAYKDWFRAYRFGNIMNPKNLEIVPLQILLFCSVPFLCPFSLSLSSAPNCSPLIKRESCGCKLNERKTCSSLFFIYPLGTRYLSLYRFILGPCNLSILAIALQLAFPFHL